MDNFEKMFKEKFLNAEEAAKILCVSAGKVRMMCRENKISYLQIGRERKIPLSVIIEYQKKSFVPARN